MHARGVRATTCLDALVQSREGRRAAQKLLRKLIREQSRTPCVMVTDKPGSDGAARTGMGLNIEYRGLPLLARPHADRGRSHALMITARARTRNPTGKRPRPSPAPSTRAVIWRCAPPKAPRQIPTLPFVQSRSQPSVRTWSWMKLGGAIIRMVAQSNLMLQTIHLAHLAQCPLNLAQTLIADASLP
jgi:hypothetical protein